MSTLSNRLKEVSTLVKKNARVVDVGSDHAYLPIYLLEQGIVDFAIASEVAKGPLSHSKGNILTHNLEHKIETRLGDGLASINATDDIDTAVIAGMGGILITEILQRFKLTKDFEIKNLILQPNIGEPLVRQWLSDNNYLIKDEKILEEDGHIYEIISAEKSNETSSYTREDYLLGPVLIQKHNNIFEKKWQHKLQSFKKTLSNIKKSKNPNQEKITQLNNDIKMLEELLNG